MELIERLKTAPPEEADQIKREIAELMGPQVFYVSDKRFEPVGEAEEVVDETEEPAEERYEPAPDWEEAVEDDEYVGQRVVRRFWRRPA